MMIDKAKVGFVYHFVGYSPTPGTSINVVQYVKAAKKIVKYAPKI